MSHFHQWTDHPDKHKTEILQLTDIMNQMDLIDIYRIFTQTQTNILSSQYLMEPSTKMTTFSVTKQILSDTIKLK